MLSIHYIREQPEQVRQNLARRNDPTILTRLDEVIALDQQYRAGLQRIEQLRNQRNTISREIAAAKAAGKDTAALLQQAAQIPTLIKELEEKNEQIQQQLHEQLLRIPNLLDASVPQGISEDDNVAIAYFGSKPQHTFPLKSHVDLMVERGWVDLERAAKVAGSRFYYLKGDLALLDLALQRYAVDLLLKQGYTLMIPPFFMRKELYAGVTDLADFENVMYKIEDEDLHLIATSEHPLVAMHADEIFEEKELPKFYAGISPCFRKEAGSHGKDTKGIFRVHQFFKVEQVILCKPQESAKFLETMLSNAEALFSSLGLYFRKVLICTGDIGTVAAKKYDLEVWMPIQGKYREVVSGSNCTDYQARRLKIRYRTPHGTAMVHTLNCTMAATSRVLVAILENFQQPDGTVKIPKVLVPYFGKERM
ncbi:MAG: serine--tRNA ligase [Candidatus Woesearchaeota archaeon]